MPYQVTLSEGGSPNCAGVYTEHVLYNGQMSYVCTNEAGTWYLYWYTITVGRPPLSSFWRISRPFPGGDIMDCWKGADDNSNIEQSYNPTWATEPHTGTATVAEYVPPAGDDTPDDFSFPAVTDADPETQYVSDPAEVTGMDAGTAIIVENGEYRLNGGEWTSEPGTIDPGSQLEVRAVTEAAFQSTKVVAVTVGGLGVNWTLTTRPARQWKFDVLANFSVIERL